jgi:Rod binding domain-containing protein
MSITPPALSAIPAALERVSYARSGKMAGAAPTTMEKINATAKDFEAQFVSEMLSSMFSTLDVKEGLGGSDAEETFQSLMVNEYGKVIARTGGIGIADQIKRDMLKLQEMESPHATPAA